MVNKGLKKGAVFSEGSLFYKIDDVDAGGNYISHCITKAEYEAETAEPVKTEPVKEAPKKTPVKKTVQKRTAKK
jgi:hypothetical protein